MSTIHFANIFVEKEYDEEIHDDFVVIKEVKIYDNDKKEIKEKELTKSFIGIKNNETDYVLVEYVAQKLGIEESNVETEYL